MRALSQETRFEFLRHRRLAGALSLVLVLISIASLGWNRLALGIDFTGGALIELSFAQPLPLDRVRNALKSQYAGAIVQPFGAPQEVLVRLPAEEASIGDAQTAVLTALSDSGLEAQVRRVEFVGPQVGEDLTVDGGLALLFTLMAVFAYVLMRFHWRLSAGAVIALAHDVILVLGVFSLFSMAFDLSVLAALLAVIGYSLNDTIVIFDRFRENVRRKTENDMARVLNTTINQTLSRTFITSGTTLLVLIALYAVGGEALSGFSLALLIGISVGTYSSVYVAGSTAIALGLKREDLLIPENTPMDDSGAPL